MKAYEAIVETLVAEGVREVFGLMGDGNMMVMSEMIRHPELTVVDTRHEGAALTMALGAAATSGRVTVCTTTCGPGLTQVGTALVDAVRGHGKVLVIAGDLGPYDDHINQYFPQSEFVTSTGAAYLRVDDLLLLPDVLARAFFLIRTQDRPVVLGVPMGLQDENYPWEWSYRAVETPAGGQRQISTDEIDALVGLLSTAQRPVVVVGSGVIDRGLDDEIRQLCDRLGALAATTLRAKGYFGDYPFAAGIAGAFSTATERDYFAQADVVLALGASMNYFTTEGGYLFGDAKIASVDSGPVRLRSEVGLELLLRADVQTVVPELLKALPEAASGTGFRTAEVRQRLAEQQPAELAQPAGENGLHPVAVVQTLDAALDPDSFVVVGVGHFWSFPIMYLRRAPDRVRVSYDFGSIGQALPTGIGVAAAAPGRSVVVIEGDGSLLVNIQEFETLRRKPLPVLVLVFNDGNYGAEYHKLKAHDRSLADVEFGRPDFAAIAVAFGLRGRRVTRVDELRGIVAEFSGDPRPTVVDIPIDPDVVSAPYLRSVFGRDA